MEIYLARQPIFDRKMKVFGYELLYRKSINNFYEGRDHNQATADLINNAFLAMKFHELTEGSKAFINFPEELILKEIPLLLSSESVVIEILETVSITDKLIIACKKLKENGYKIALDDFVFNEDYLPLLEIADIIKVEFQSMSIKKQRDLILKYKKNIKFVAEKVETREEYEAALKIGYDYFQGYFFSKPLIIKGREINTLKEKLIRMLIELNQEEVDYNKITKIVETDIGLTYKFLKIGNSVFFGAINEISSIRQVLVRLGEIEIKKWIYLLMFKEIERLENRELIKTCLIRAKFLELLAIKKHKNTRSIEYFMTGLFSSIDILLNRSMKEIVEELPLPIDVRLALLGEDNEIKRTLDRLMYYETFEWDDMKKENLEFPIEDYMIIYIESLKWASKLEY
jgi:EAL and modified HD-GYP domain-containing signal transduction protein